MSYDEYVEREFDVDDLHVEIVADTHYSLDMAGVRDEPLSEIVTWSYDRNGIGDRGMTPQEAEAVERGGWPLLVRYLRTARHALCVLPLSGISHSGESVWVASSVNETSPWDTAGWDSGQWGFVVVFRDKAEEFGIPGTSGGMTLPYKADVPLSGGGLTLRGNGRQTIMVTTVEQEAARQARGEVEEYNDVLTGNVYGYRILRDGEVEESCWGFVGDPETNVVPEARAVAESMPRQQSLGLVQEGVTA